MEQIKSGWDLFLLPKAWHKRLSASMLSLVPGFVIVGLFDVLARPRTILNDFILGAASGFIEKTFLFVITFIIIGFLDVFCFAWPVADLCRYIAKRSNKFIMHGFNVIFMKSYAYSHLLFYPVLLILNPTGLEFEKLGQETSAIAQIIIITLYVWGFLQRFLQPGIMLRTISIKSKLELSGKLIAALFIFVWMNIQGQAVGYLIDLAYKMFDSLYKFT